MADEVPADRQVCQRFNFGPEFLRPALAHVRAAGGDEPAYDIGRYIFCNGYEFDFGRGPAAPLRRRGDASADLCEVGGETGAGVHWVVGTELADLLVCTPRSRDWLLNPSGKRYPSS